ncbi:hypothetical protein [Streptomyces sp. NPDC059861]|uniref:hypothetical protein n=1 Tax=Streptomyces sp. NPDC059861 TaxID=3346974 RepID=UPI00365825E9
MDWMHESVDSSSALKESCVLGESKAADEALYYLSASYGPYAQALRSATDEGNSLNAFTGTSGDRARERATASCADGVRAIFRISTTVYAAPTKSLLLSALKTFAERSARKHGCTDVELPS